MGTKTMRSAAARAVMSVVVAGTLTAQVAALPRMATAPIPFAPLDVVLPHVLVTAMAIRPDGTIYAGGRYLIPINDPHATPPVLVAGSVWAVSHDHGARWTTHISSIARTPPNSRLWRAPSLWPDAFTANGIAVDATNPRVLYVAGCMSETACAGSSGGHYLLRSSDGGRTWRDALVFDRLPKPHGNIVVTPLLQHVLRRGGTQVTQAYDVAVDPRNGKRVYACVSGVGMLRSNDGARTWHYVAQPLWLNGHGELLIDPSNTAVVYSLDRQNKVLYRTINGGASWTIRSSFAEYNQDILVLSGLTLLGHVLYMTGLNGIYGSMDGGAHWKVAVQPPTSGTMGPSIRGDRGWITAFVPKSNIQPEGLYAIRDGAPWQLAANTDQRGLRYYGSLDFQSYGAGLIRMWEDHRAHIVFTIPQTGGVYRWSSGL